MGWREMKTPAKTLFSRDPWVKMLNKVGNGYWRALIAFKASNAGHDNAVIFTKHQLWFTSNKAPNKKSSSQLWMLFIKIVDCACLGLSKTPSLAALHVKVSSEIHFLSSRTHPSLKLPLKCDEYWKAWKLRNWHWLEKFIPKGDEQFLFLTLLLGFYFLNILSQLNSLHGFEI